MDFPQLLSSAPDVYGIAPDDDALDRSNFNATSGRSRAQAAPRWHDGQPSARGLLNRAALAAGRAADRRAAGSEPMDQSGPPPGVRGGQGASVAAAAAPSATSATAGFSDYHAFGGVIPHSFPMGRAPFRDLNGQMQQPTGRICDTETVWMTGQVLKSALQYAAPAARDLPIAAYLDLDVDVMLATGLFRPLSMDAAVVREQRIKCEVVQALTRLDASPTFRLLVRMAAAKDRLPVSGPGRWTARLILPLGFDHSPYASDCNGKQAVYGGDFRADHGKRILTLPASTREPVAGRYYLATDGVLQPMSAQACMIRSLVSALTNAVPIAHQPWTCADGAIDPRRIVQLGMGERGVVDALTQRIVRELDPSAAPWLSPLPFRDQDLIPPRSQVVQSARFQPALRQALAEIGGLSSLQAYVMAQDDYLDARYPVARG
ncbi:hypothetical protein BOSP111201_13090 [Bordetella sputigena]|uniref:hypothetical protein n=1 Tax=Bordetella sputigena TaxID=1416810 RepID=UPI0039EF1A2A